MNNSLKKMIAKILELYTHEETASMLGVSSKSIQNYSAGKPPAKKTIRTIEEVYRKLEENNWKHIPLDKIVLKPSGDAMTVERVLLHVLVREFAEFKSEQTGQPVDSIIKDLESKARIIINVSGKI